VSNNSYWIIDSHYNAGHKKIKKNIQGDIFFNIEMKTYWIESSQPGLTRKVCKLGYETLMTL
jgi:hypothetical protein